MSLPDATASAALGETVIKPVWFAYLDFVSDPARANTSGADLTITGSGKPDLDGTYKGLDHRLVEISPVKSGPGGGDTVTVRLSGLRGIDDDDRILLANPANWQGRTVRLWRMIRNAANVQQGAIQHYYTGYMMSLLHAGSPDDLTIEIAVESYLAAFSAASNRTYLNSEDYDPGDLSSRAAIAIANGNSSSPLTGVAPTQFRGGGGGFSGMFGGLIERMREQER